MAKRKKQSDVKRARQEARPVELPRADEQLSVAIVGGGASGIAAACAVAACARAAQVGVRVVLLEKGRRMGSSILRSGNGRCNFSHEDMRPVLFNQPAFVEQVFDALEAAFANSPLKTSGAPVRSAYENAVLQWFTSLGLVWREAPLSGGALYPFSNKAASVLEVLEAELDRCAVERYCGVTVAQIAQQKDRFALELQRTEESSPGRGGAASANAGGTAAKDAEGAALGDRGTFLADAVVYAAGGGASSLHEQGVLTGIERISCQPVLGPLATSTELLFGLDGIRARVRLSCDAKGFSEEGELLFRSYGISGIVVFNASRFVEAGDVVSLDFVPERSLARLVDLLQARAAFLELRNGSAPTALDLLRGFFVPEVAHAIVRSAIANCLGAVGDRAMAAGIEAACPLDETTIEAIAKAIKSFELEVKGIGDAGQCQVQRGGFCSGSVNAKTMEASAVSGLYLCGEALDVDAPCGGYNLHWAWSSGLLAGLSIARDLNLLKRKTPPVPFESADARRKDDSFATDPAWRIAASALERESA
ncbi:MAG: NAD(P)/FAD-dependent oxidoreductase [Eggerthellaceae bacterium]|nr:NAD(P)/FAD-dependent oxidoreductase [Eggerthellaceae bacterium]